MCLCLVIDLQFENPLRLLHGLRQEMAERVQVLVVERNRDVLAFLRREGDDMETAFRGLHFKSLGELGIVAGGTGRDLLLKWLGKIRLGDGGLSLERDDGLRRDGIALPTNLGLKLHEPLQMRLHHRLDEALG